MLMGIHLLFQIKPKPIAYMPLLLTNWAHEKIRTCLFLNKSISLQSDNPNHDYQFLIGSLFLTDKFIPSWSCIALPKKEKGP